MRWRSLLANPFLHPTVAVRRAVLVEANLNYDPRLPAAQDYDLWSRVLRHTDGANLPMPLVRYRIHDGQMTSVRRDDQLDVHDRVAARTISFELPEIDIAESQVRDLRALFHGRRRASERSVSKPPLCISTYSTSFSAEAHRRVLTSRPSSRRRHDAF